MCQLYNVAVNVDICIIRGAPLIVPLTGSLLPSGPQSTALADLLDVSPVGMSLVVARTTRELHKLQHVLTKGSVKIRLLHPH